jgi:FMN hydrolase / 5-amino-6-(5-phospho-D-ribitylamino)uracil phosphatase
VTHLTAGTGIDVDNAGMPRVIAFDVDGTLVDLLPAIHAGLAAALDELRALTPAATSLGAAHLQADCAAILAGRRDAPIAEVRRAGLARTLAGLGVTDPHALDRVAAAFFVARYAELRLYPDALPTLTALRPEYILGVGSNGNSHARRCGLGDMFAFEVYAHVDGVPPKPGPGFFARLVAAAGADPGDIVYVGDSLDDDMVPAAAAGLRTVWLNRLGAPVPDGLRCDAVITTLADLPATLQDRHNFPEVVAMAGS